LEIKKINFTMAFLVLFTLFITGTVMAENMNKNGDGETLKFDEEAGLLYMREEEKLARDVYRVLWEKWGLRVFENIAESEQRHMDAVLYLLGKYGLDDPALDPGIFQNSELQDLYDELVKKGETSIVNAIEVGITIEETDLADLEALLGQTEKKDIIQVYTNLLDGSYRHLDAFESHL
jgi:hypothetical protein